MPNRYLLSFSLAEYDMIGSLNLIDRILFLDLIDRLYHVDGSPFHTFLIRYDHGHGGIKELWASKKRNPSQDDAFIQLL